MILLRVMELKLHQDSTAFLARALIDEGRLGLDVPTTKLQGIILLTSYVGIIVDQTIILTCASTAI